MNELISVIVPIYNAEKYMEKCVKSIMMQTYTKIEIILIDDGSRDNSSKICDKLAKEDTRIRVIHKENEGVASARNAGIHLSKGEFITFVDSDDWIEKDFIETLYNTLERNKVDVVRGNYYREGKNKTLESGRMNNFENIKIQEEDDELRKELLKSILNGSLLSYVWLLLIKKKLLIEKKIQFKRNISFMEDTMFYLEIVATKASMYIINKSIYHYNNNLQSASKSLGNAQKNILNILNVNKEMNIILNKYDVANKKELNIEMSTNHINMILNLYFNLYKEKAINTKDLKCDITKIMEKDKLVEILKNANSKIMPLHFKIQYWCVKNQRINILILYYKIRRILLKLKK